MTSNSKVQPYFQKYQNHAKMLIAGLALTGLVTVGNTQAFASAELKEDLAKRGYPLSLSGSYLAALTANRAKDITAASLYYDEALKADPGNQSLIERAFFLRLVDGDINGAISISSNILDRDGDNWFAHMALGVTSLRSKSYKKAINAFEQMTDGPLAELTGGLLHAWALAADGQHDAALELLGKLDSNEAFTPHTLFHSALIAENGGKIEEAAKLYDEANKADPNLVRKIEAITRFQYRNGMEAEGKENLDRLVERLPNRSSVKALVAEVADGKKPAAHVSTALIGAMEVLYGIGSIIGTDDNTEVSYIFMNLASYVDPENPLPRLLLGNLLENDERYSKAIESYEGIKKDSIHFQNARLRAAFAYNSLEKLDDARGIMKDLIASDPNDITTITSYGNILRSHDLFEEARTTYSDAISKIEGEPTNANWSLYYSRGITNERTDRWTEAETDFRMALKLSPDEPQVLNYLGYSLIDLGMKYEEALKMIEKAVELRPQDPFIIDSLGWAHYKLKNYDEAVKSLERAVQLRPQDPILNDHLGDAYWHVGRKLEAQFQWRHARDLDPDEKYRDTIVKKIETGQYVESDG
ncbi:MAG: tetratricopeptide repeat protein [Hyphomicrobiales bacterium]